MKNNLKLLNSSIILFTLSVLCIFSAPVWSCSSPPPRPVAVLDISPDPAVVGQTVLLDGSDSYTPSGYINKYEWDFTNNGSYDYYETSTYHPDGAFDGKTTYIYTEANTYTAKLRVRNSDTYYDTDIDTVVIEEPNVLVVYTYDEVGNKISMTDSSGTTSYSYDYLGRLISVTNPDQKTISYQYDAGGNRTQLTDPNGNITAYTYDDNNRLTDVNAPAGSTTYQYDSLGNQVRADYHNGTYAEYSYNPQRNWLVSLVNKDPNAAVLSSYSYTYDAVGNRLSVTEADDSNVSYGYDDIYQLTSETRTGTNAYSITYQYDDVGNRTQMVKDGNTTSYTCNINNQLLTETSADANITYAYDDNGNLLSKTDANDANNNASYTWDWNNRLLSVSEADGNTVYEYDGDGTRISKTQDAVKTKYISDVALGLVQVLMETTDTNAVQATYTYGNDLIAMNRAGTVSYYHYDGLGSTRQLTNSSGGVTVSYIYDSFGSVIARTIGEGMASSPAWKNEPTNKAGITLFAFLGLGVGAVTIRNRRHGLIIFLIIVLITGQIPTAMAVEVDVTGNPYGFTGEQQFGEANDLVFLRARYYAPSVGRFISRDPILSPLQVGDNFFWPLPYLTGNPQIMNSYVYCANNPVNNVDPEGMAATVTLVILGVVVVITFILTIDCLIKIGRALKKANEARKGETDEEACDTQGRWKKTIDEFLDAIKSCGMPIYIG